MQTLKLEGKMKFDLELQVINWVQELFWAWVSSAAERCAACHSIGLLGGANKKYSHQFIVEVRCP